MVCLQECPLGGMVDGQDKVGYVAQHPQLSVAKATHKFFLLLLLS